MVDISAIGAALSSFNTLKNIAQSMVALHDSQTVQSKVIEFNGALIDAQTKIFAVNEERTTLIDRVRELEKQVADLKAWEAEKQRYEMVALAPNVIAYAAKEAMRGSEPMHLFCGNCFNKGQKLFLQQTIRGDEYDRYRCNGCSEELGIDKSGGRRGGIQFGVSDDYDPFGRS